MVDEGEGPGGWFDWNSPLREAAELIYIVLVDAGVILAIAIIAEGLKKALTLVSQEPLSWSINSYTLTLNEIVHNGDLFTFLVFIVVASWHILKWARKQWK